MSHWTESVDYYLYRDHSARKRTMYRCVAVGTVVGLACEVAHLPRLACYLAMFLSVGVAMFAMIWLYVKAKERP
jgi:hypothetical protein